MTIKMALPLKILICICLSPSLVLIGCSLVTTKSFPSTPTPSQTQTISVEPSLVFETVTPTLTPQPTLPIEKVKEKILNLLETNGGCQLPCWWGIVPGETSVQEVLSFFEPFASEIFVEDTGVAVFIWETPEEISPGNEISFDFLVSAGIVSHIDVHGIQGADLFRLPLVLTNYGQPNEIWIRTFSPNPGENTVPFSVIAFYGNQGFVAYWQGSGDVRGNIIHGCIESSPSLYLWSPDPNISTIIDTTKLFDPILPGGALRLTEASGMNEETFYNSFRGFGGPVCLDTPKSLWLGVYGQTPSP